MKRNIFIVAGEPSGDVHAAAIVAALKKNSSNNAFSGIAGPAMRQEGVEIFLPMEELAVMGFTDVIKALPTLARAFKATAAAIRRQQPEMVILVDYQEFNMLLARSLRKGGYKGKIVQYIGPSVWAWRPNRARTLERYVDLLLTIPACTSTAARMANQRRAPAGPRGGAWPRAQVSTRRCWPRPDPAWRDSGGRTG
jgi:lipid-A-disaccharide synthase